jgi:hypothetical protein
MQLLLRLLSSTGGRTILVFVGGWLAWQGWMAYSAPGRIEPGLLQRAEEEERIPVLVKLPFEPERFHVLKVQEVGRVRRVKGNVIEVRAIDADGIRRLARQYYWIDRIEGGEIAR